MGGLGVEAESVPPTERRWERKPAVNAEVAPQLRTSLGALRCTPHLHQAPVNSTLRIARRSMAGVGGLSRQVRLNDLPDAREGQHHVVRLPNDGDVMGGVVTDV